MNNVKDGDIILLHDTFKAGADAAVILIKELTERGFQLVTVQELIEIKSGEMIPGGIYKTGYGTVGG
jgi:peptidoglycan/xylan/chitin deacetylase (PgdA/CDA1 family)